MGFFVEAKTADPGAPPVPWQGVQYLSYHSFPFCTRASCTSPPAYVRSGVTHPTITTTASPVTICFSMSFLRS